MTRYPFLGDFSFGFQVSTKISLELLIFSEPLSNHHTKRSDCGRQYSQPQSQAHLSLPTLSMALLLVISVPLSELSQLRWAPCLPKPLRALNPPLTPLRHQQNLTSSVVAIRRIKRSTIDESSILTKPCELGGRVDYEATG